MSTITTSRRRSLRSTASGYRLVFAYLFLFLAVVGIITLSPLLLMIIYRNETDCLLDFLIPGLSCVLIGTGGFLALTIGREKARLGKHQDSVLLVLIWLSAILVGALPFYLAQYFGNFASEEIRNVATYSFSEAFFESMSGYSATGLTIFRIFVDSEYVYCEHIFIFYRSIIQFFGGVGLVLVVASIVSDRYGMKLFSTEGHNDRLIPNLKRTAQLTFGIFFLIIIGGSFFLWLFGLDYFDAINHSIAAVATGGFSSRSAGFAYYFDGSYAGNGIMPFNSWGVELTMCVLMILGATSFLLNYNLLTLKWKKFIKDAEVKFTVIFLIVFITLATIGVAVQMTDEEGFLAHPAPIDAFRFAGFQVISCLTTTGFGNVKNMALLGEATFFISIIAMLIGGGMGSTAGAIKQYRVVIALKELYWSLKYRLSSKRTVHSHYLYRAGSRVEITQDDFKENTLYIVLYMVVVIVVTLSMSYLPQLDFGRSLYEVASALSGTGNTLVDFLSYKASNPLTSYNTMLWSLSGLMFMGRLEILPIFFAIYRVSRDIAGIETA